MAACTSDVTSSGCTSNADCGDETLYCEKAVGDCDGIGECRERPDCFLDCDGWCDVCGCDGVTYSGGGECPAQQAGVSVAHLGKCDWALCSDDVECRSELPDADPSRVCLQPEGVCGVAEPDGGQTSGEDAGTDGAVADAGVDAGVAGCRDNDDCGDDAFYCEKAIGDCDGVGECRERMACEAYDCDFCEVCGCDGVTYTNDVAAQWEGVNIAHLGKCAGDVCIEDIECQGTFGGVCPREFADLGPLRVCLQPEGVCGVADEEGDF